MLISEENELLKQIAKRADGMFVVMEYEFILMELRIVHREICALRLQDLLDADDKAFAEDMMGIYKNLDMLDGRFRDGWSPKYGR